VPRFDPSPSPLTLDVLANDPSCIQSLPPDLLSTLYRQAARLEAELRAYLLPAGPQNRDQPTPASHDQALPLREAAALLHISSDTLYRKWRRLDFAYRDPLDGRLKFSRRGLERYVEHHLKRAATRP